jgi:VIT1/CCC1 family predicted Fe2+/Mn2+ transporter
VFGGLDGIITTFAIVAASVGSGLTFTALLIIGFSNLIGDAFSMGLGDYFSSKAEVEQANKLRKQYLWRCEKEPEKQKVIMRGLFMDKGFTDHESSVIVECLGENKRVFADVMLLEIEGVQADDSNWIEPIKEGIITFCSFIVFGAVPLISFIFAPSKQKSTKPDVFFYVSIGLTAVSLFMLGALKNLLVKKSTLKGGLIMLIQGGIATGMAYLAGWGLERAFARS